LIKEVREMRQQHEQRSIVTSAALIEAYEIAATYLVERKRRYSTSTDWAPSDDNLDYSARWWYEKSLEIAVELEYVGEKSIPLSLHFPSVALRFTDISNAYKARRKATKKEYKASISQESDMRKCFNCNSTSNNLKKCGGCGQFAYCSKECQKTHWKKGHKEACGQMKDVKDKVDQLSSLHVSYKGLM
ncbi:hypothetical protein HDU79_001034, partial [Rhizoclosmatium sp. JEL0117]